MSALGLIALAGLAFAALVHATLLVLAGLAGSQRAIAYPALVVACASLLAWQGMIDLSWLPAAVAATLLLASAGVLIARRQPLRPPAFSRLEWGLLLLLAIGALCAAFPSYRPDQWNNDLILAKAVAAGPLRAPIFEEHVYYGGLYQYLFTLARWFSRDDVFNQSAADAFSWLLLAIGLAGLLARMRADAFPRSPPVMLLVVWVIFATPDSTAIANAKPDPLILLAALALVDLSAGPRPGDSRSLHGFLLGFLLVAPVALKLTWAHFLCAAFLAWLCLLAVRRPPPPPAPRFFAIGSLAGLVACSPYVLTNWRFFGNPLHPAQLGPLRSRYWSEDFSRYYGEVAGRAGSPSEYLSALAQLIPMLSWHLYFVLVPVLLIALVALLSQVRRADRIAPRGTLVLRHAIAAGALFVLVWPLFFRYNVYPRYMYAGLALALVALSSGLGRLVDWGEAAAGAAAAWRRRLAVVALLLPALCAPGLPEDLAFVARFGLKGRDRLYVEGPPEWRMAHDLALINAHRRVASPEATFHARTTLMDSTGGYLLDSAAYQDGSREFRWLEATLGHGRGAECPWLMLSRLDVAYVRARGSFAFWSEPYRRVAALLPALEDSGRIRYLAPGVAAAFAATERPCSEVAAR